MKRYYYFLTMVLAVASCVKPGDKPQDDHDIFIQTPHKVSGKAEKGPMVKGSSIEIRTMTKDLLPDGSSYTANITSDAGDFDFGDLQLTSPFAKLTADGYFFNEVQGALSAGTIRLESIVDLADNTTINVNLLTHLKSQRILKLVGEKKLSFAQANEQAQKELMTAFGLQGLNLSTDVSQFSISGGDDASAALIAVSTLILGNRREAAIVEFLSTLTTEFGETGAFSDASKAKFEKSMGDFRCELDKIAENVKKRYSQLGKEVEVKDLAYFYDWDGDGVAGNEIPTGEVTLSQSEIRVPVEGGSFSVSLNFDKLLLSRQNQSSDDDSVVVNPGYNSLYEIQPTRPIQLEKSIEGKTLTVKVSPAEFYGSDSKTIEIYDYVDRKVAELTVIQEGKPAPTGVPNLSDEGKKYVNYIIKMLSETIRNANTMERNYVMASPFQPFSPSSYEVYNLFSAFYRPISETCQIKRIDAEQRVVYQHFCDSYLATCYLYMMSYWGDVPFYIMPLDETNYYLPRTSVSEICSTLAERISSAFDKFEDKTFNSEAGTNDIFFIPRDAAKLIVAKLYLMNKEYSRALDIYKEIIGNGRYSLTEGDNIVYGPNSELIFTFLSESGTRAGVTLMEPRFLDLKDVILDAAECALMLGDVSAATKYVNDFCAKKNFEVSESCDIARIGELRKKILSPFLMPFLYRNGLENLVGAEHYQLLWPIPYQELAANPYMTQNPGY